jgi:hypothetical protein
LRQGHLQACDRSRLRTAALLAVLCAAALTTTACGNNSDDRTELRPPVPINISVEIGTSRVTASPAKFGAGPIALLVSNQSGASQTLTIDGPQVRQSVGPINPQDTATLKVSVGSGEFTLAADQASGLKATKLEVGPARPSAQNQLLLP